MKIPALFYGKPGQVTSRVRKLAAKLVESQDFGSYDPGPLLDTNEVSGSILVSEGTELSGEQHFHCYRLSEALIDASPHSERRANINRWLMASLDEEWRFMGTLSGDARLGLFEQPASCSRRYAEAAVRHWPAMARERNRFGPAIIEGWGILDSWLTLFIALENLGLPSLERMLQTEREPLGLLDLVDRKRASL